MHLEKGGTTGQVERPFHYSNDSIRAANRLRSGESRDIHGDIGRVFRNVNPRTLRGYEPKNKFHYGEAAISVAMTENGIKHAYELIRPYVYSEKLGTDLRFSIDFGTNLQIDGKYVVVEYHNPALFDNVYDFEKFISLTRELGDIFHLILITGVGEKALRIAADAHGASEGPVAHEVWKLPTWGVPLDEILSSQTMDQLRLMFAELKLRSLERAEPAEPKRVPIERLVPRMLPQLRIRHIAEMVPIRAEPEVANAASPVTIPPSEVISGPEFNGFDFNPSQ